MQKGGGRFERNPKRHKRKKNKGEKLKQGGTGAKPREKKPTKEGKAEHKLKQKKNTRDNKKRQTHRANRKPEQ
jgi:hypothetical protein